MVEGNCSVVLNDDSLVFDHFKIQMDEEQRLQFVEEFVMSSYDNTTNTNFIDFIVEHIDELPMFFDPNITKITFKRD